MTRLYPEWRTLFQDADPGRSASAFATLERFYNEPHRHYHTRDHIEACLNELVHARTADSDRDVVSVALLCHDVFYDTKAINNERRSAVWCRNVTRMLGRPDLGEKAAPCILATRHDRKPEGPDAELVCDIDLSILGAEPAVFDEYERQIREEYDWVPEAAFRAGRAKILRGLLEGGSIYKTWIYRYKYEKQASENLQRSIAALETEKAATPEEAAARIGEG